MEEREREERDVSDIWINAHPSRYSARPMTECPFLVAGCVVLLPSCQGIHFYKKEVSSVDERWCDDAILAVTGCCGQFSKQSSWIWVAYHQPSYKGEDETESKCIPSDPRRRFEREWEWLHSGVVCFSSLLFSRHLSMLVYPCRATRRMN